MTARLLTAAGLALATALALHAAPACAAGQLNAYATCPDGQHLVVDWGWYEEPGTPTGYPQWTGFDLLRRDVVACGPWVRVNDAPYPRLAGQSQSGQSSEVAPAVMTLYEYELLPVDASHQAVIIGSFDCNPPCVPHTWVSCPQGSAPNTVAKVVDWGWTVFLQSCTGSCMPSFYVGNPTIAGELRAFIGTGQVLAFYGDTGCGTIEGCSLTVTHYELAGCGPVAVTRPSWGRVKTLYR